MKAVLLLAMMLWSIIGLSQQSFTDSQSDPDDFISCGFLEDMVSYIEPKSPEFPGGTDALHQYVMDRITCPVTEDDEPFEGIIYVKFLVGTDGQITDVNIYRGATAGHDQQLIQLFENMPAWVAGEHLGVKVSVQMGIPIRY